MYRCRWQRHRGALSAISYSHTHAMIVKETRARASISSGQSIKTISSKVFTMSKEYSRSDQFSLTGAATEEDQLLLLALQESASMHQVSIGSEACSKYYQATSRGGIRLLQLPIINQFHPQWNHLISKYNTASAICGYTAIACARFIASLQSPLAKADLQKLLTKFASLSGLVEHSMKYIHDWRSDYILKNAANFNARSKNAFMKEWVANFEISDYFRHSCPSSERPKIAFVRFNQYSQLGHALHEERRRITAHESGFDDTEILVETFYDKEFLVTRPHFHRPSQCQTLPPLCSAVVDVNGHFACAAMCTDGTVLFNTTDASYIAFPGGETTAVALSILAGGHAEVSGSDSAAS